MEFAGLMVEHILPPYRALMESYEEAQNVQKTDTKRSWTAWSRPRDNAA